MPWGCLRTAIGHPALLLRWSRGGWGGRAGGWMVRVGGMGRGVRGDGGGWGGGGWEVSVGDQHKGEWMGSVDRTRMGGGKLQCSCEPTRAGEWMVSVGGTCGGGRGGRGGRGEGGKLRRSRKPTRVDGWRQWDAGWGGMGGGADWYKSTFARTARKDSQGHSTNLSESLLESCDVCKSGRAANLSNFNPTRTHFRLLVCGKTQAKQILLARARMTRPICSNYHEF